MAEVDFREPQAPALPDIDLVAELVARVAPTIDVAADQETLIWPGDLPSVIDGFAADRGGVWCSGAAAVLKFEAETLGWAAATVQYGFPGTLTHDVTLILSTEGWVIADAYLGNVWDKTYEDAIEILEQGDPVSFSGRGATRDVHFKEIPSKATAHWTIGQSNSYPLNCRSEGNRHICRLHHDAEDLAEGLPLVTETLRILASEGYPDDLSFLLLFPYGMVVGDTYMDVAGTSNVLDNLYKYESARLR